MTNALIRIRRAVPLRARLMLYAGLFVVLSLPACGRFKKEPDPNDVLAKAGEAEITVGEFKDALKRFLPEGAEGMPQTELTEIKKSLLNQIIEERLILKEAKTQGVAVTDDELAKQLELLQQAYGEEDFKNEVIKQYGDLNAWRKDILKQMTIRKIIEKSIKVEVTEAEAKEYFEKNLLQEEGKEAVHARMIVVPTEKAAVAALRRLKAETFESVAKDVSTGPEAKDGGDLGFFEKGGMPPEFEEAIFSLSPGQTSGIVKSPYGYHIFKLIEVKKSKKQAYNEVRGKIIEALKREKTEHGYTDWVLLLKQKSTIEIKEELL
ncbi:MAG: peptidyl-prolyl cis-trans isomerase [Thermodesulfobacteriota bacterium]